MLDAVRTLIGIDFATLSDFDLRTSTVVENTHPDRVLPAAAGEASERHINEHPLTAHYARTGEDRAYKAIDFISPSRLQHLALKHEFVMPTFDTRCRIAIAVAAHPARIVGFSRARALARERRDVCERDRLVLNVLRLPLAQAVGHAEADSAQTTSPSRGRVKDAMR